MNFNTMPEDCWVASEMDSSFPGWQQELAWPERASHCLVGILSQYKPGSAMLELAFFYYTFQVLVSLPSSQPRWQVQCPCRSSFSVWGFS